MNKFFIAVTGCATVLSMVSGCYYTRIASPESSPEMQEWEKAILDSYPGYRPPTTTSRNYKGKAESRVSSVPQKLEPMSDMTPAAPQQNDAEAAPVEIAEPAAQDENKAEPQTPAVEEVTVEKPAEEPAVEEVKPAADEEKKADEAQAPAAAEEKKADEAQAPAAEEKKADEAQAPAAEEKKADEAQAPAAAEEKKVDDGNMPPDPTNSTIYTVQPGDSLGAIAKKHYGNARYSNVIFKANRDILKDPNKLRPGMKLIIPKL